MLTQQFSTLSTDPSMTNRRISASADGDTIVLPTYESLIPSSAKPVFIYDASVGLLAPTSAFTTSSEQVSVSRTGSGMVMTTLTTDDTASRRPRVFSYSPLNPLGDLGPDINAFALSPDGSVVYAYFGNTGLIRKFSTLSPFAELGSGTPVASPGTFSSLMVVSPDGGTLFLAGNQRVIVLPAP
jgi:hypothetical protein